MSVTISQHFWTSTYLPIPALPFPVQSLPFSHIPPLSLSLSLFHSLRKRQHNNKIDFLQSVEVKASRRPQQRQRRRRRKVELNQEIPFPQKNLPPLVPLLLQSNPSKAKSEKNSFLFKLFLLLLTYLQLCCHNELNKILPNSLEKIYRGLNV